MRTSLACPIGFLLLILAPDLLGQTAPAVGTRLRLWLREPSQVAIGTYSRATRDSVTLAHRRTGEMASFSWQEIQAIEEYRGAQGHSTLGGMVGLGFGGLAGAWFGSKTAVGELSSTTTGVAGAVVGGLIGGLFGAMIGHLTRSEIWRPIVGWDPANGRRAVRFGIRLQQR